MTPPDVAEARKRKAAKRYLHGRRAVSRIDSTDLPTGVLVLLCKLIRRCQLPSPFYQQHIDAMRAMGMRKGAAKQVIDLRKQGVWVV